MLGRGAGRAAGTTDRTRLVLTGAVAGLAWAAGLRGWMVQMAAGEGSRFHWYGTFLLILLPGVLVGAALGLAEHRRRRGLPRSRVLVLAPLLFSVALLDPTIFRQFVTEGIGGGSLGVALTGLAGGFALSGRGRPWWRRTCGVLATLLVLMMLVLAGEQLPLGEPHGLWVGLYASSLVALLCVACAIPQRADRAVLVPASWQAVLIGGVAGLAWAASLRAFMWEVAGNGAVVDYAGTIVWVLLQGVIIGAVLAWAQWRRGSGPIPHRRWVVWSPMLFAAVLLSDPPALLSGFDGGVGLGALGVPAMSMLGAYAMAGRGPVVVRWVCGVLFASSLPIWVLTAQAIGGPSLSVSTPHGAWAAVLYWSLLATFALAASVPHRHPTQAVPSTRMAAAATVG